MTLGAAAAAQVRLIVWYKACQHQVGPIRRRWLLGTAPAPASSIGARGLSGPAAADGRWISS
jgi:hypothetical protein